MTGSQQMLLAAGGGLAPPGQQYGAFGQSPVGVNASAHVAFNADGSVTRNNNGSSVAGIPPWLSPVSAGAGAGYWVRFTRVFGNVATNGTEGVWQQLNANRAIGYTATTATVGGQWTAAISNSATGTPVLRSFTVDVNVDHFSI